MISANSPILPAVNIANTEKWYKQFWPWFLIVLPVAVIIGCLISIVIAFKHADPIVQGDYAQHGLTVLHKTSSSTNNHATTDAAR